MILNSGSREQFRNPLLFKVQTFRKLEGESAEMGDAQCGRTKGREEVDDWGGDGGLDNDDGRKGQLGGSMAWDAIPAICYGRGGRVWRMYLLVPRLRPCQVKGLHCVPLARHQVLCPVPGFAAHHTLDKR